MQLIRNYFCVILDIIIQNSMYLNLWASLVPTYFVKDMSPIIDEVGSLDVLAQWKCDGIVTDYWIGGSSFFFEVFSYLAERNRKSFCILSKLWCFVRGAGATFYHMDATQCGFVYSLKNAVQILR